MRIWNVWCCGLNENDPHWIRCLNTWFHFGATVWIGLGDVSSWRKSVTCSGIWGFKSYVLFPVFSLLHACCTRCEILVVSVTVSAICCQDSLPWCTPSLWNCNPLHPKPFFLSVALIMMLHHNNRKVTNTEGEADRMETWMKANAFSKGVCFWKPDIILLKPWTSPVRVPHIMMGNLFDLKWA